MTAPTGVRPSSRAASRPQIRVPDALARLADQTTLAARRMWRNRTVSALVVISLAVGVGANTAIFSLIDALFLAPLPFHDSARLVALQTTDPKNPGRFGFSYLNFLDLRANARSFESLALCSGLFVNVGDTGNVTQHAAELATPDYFRALGIQASLGRAFSSGTLDDADENTARVAVISHKLWQDRYQSDPDVIGSTVRINQMAFRVVAVMPESFRGLERLGTTDLWLPLANFESLADQPSWIHSRRALMFMVVGRLADGITAKHALTEAAGIAQKLAKRYPESNTGRSFHVASLDEVLLGHERREKLLASALVAFAAACLVLLIAIANASNLLLGHSAGRRREMAMRLAAGATGRDFFSQILLESLLLVAAGWVIGLLLGIAGREILWNLRPSDFAKDTGLYLNPRVLLFSMLISLAAGALANLLPVLQTLKGDLWHELKPPAPVHGKLRCRITARWLVVAQVAMSLVTLVSAELFLRRHQSVQQIDPGFDSRNMTLTEVNPRRLGLSPQRRADFYANLLQRLERLPGVRSAAIASDPVFGFHRLARTVRLGDDVSKPARFVPVTEVSNRYFETTDILILRGRALTAGDCGSSELTAVVNEEMARMFWPGGQALGKKFRLFGDMEDRTVVGIARDTAYRDLGNGDEPLVYVPMSITGAPNATVHVRTESNPAALAQSIAAEIRAAEPLHPAPEVRTISEVMDHALWAPRMAAGLLTTFGLLAMFLATLGVYGVTSHFVSQRIVELGVRMAMGACPLDVKQLILRQAISLILPGLLIGAVAAFASTRLMRAAMLPVSDLALEPYAIAVLLLAVCGFAASYLPARRAVKLLPAGALRQQ